ncbi:hypothetical protein MRX96_046919 [Rhipicephalus microplus]
MDELWSSDSADSKDFGREEDVELADPAKHCTFDPLVSSSEEEAPDNDNAMQGAPQDRQHASICCPCRPF